MYLFLILCSIFSCNSYQRIDYNSPSQEIVELTQEHLSKNAAARKRILFNAVKDYINASSFLDENGKVTDDSVWEFRKQFESGAMIYDDIHLIKNENKLIEFRQYAEHVQYYMGRKGLKVEYDEFDINSFYSGGEEQYKPRIDDSVEDNDVYFYTYSMEKRIYNILNKNNQVLNYDEPMIYPIEIEFRISIKNQNAEIVSIRPTKK